MALQVLLDSNVHQPQPAWSLVRGDGNCSLVQLEGAKMATPGLCHSKESLRPSSSCRSSIISMKNKGYRRI